MDGLKLEKWKANFATEVQKMQIEYDAFFMTKKLSDYFDLNTDDTGQNLILQVHGNDLPTQIKERLEHAFWKAQPEDSI